VLDKNAKRYSKFHQDAVRGINELLLRLDPNAKDLLTMNAVYEPVQMPSDSAKDSADSHDVAEDSVDGAPGEARLTTETDGDADRETQTETDAVRQTETGSDDDTVDAPASARRDTTDEDGAQ
jgi:hypothetical protein